MKNSKEHFINPWNLVFTNSLRVIRSVTTCIIFIISIFNSPLAISAEHNGKIDLWLNNGIKGYALVIGNSSYKYIAPLKNPANDAKDIATALDRLGFIVTLKLNADHRSMESEIMVFGRKLRKGGVGLLYYAGHGVQVSGRNFLVPVDANVESESDIKFEAVDVGRVLGKMDDAGNGINIIILDACRNNPFASKFRTSTLGLAEMEAPTGSILAYATAPGAVAIDGEGRNGLYTSQLLKYINHKGLSIEELFKKVRIDVMKESNNQQVPWESSSLTTNFYFVSPEQDRNDKTENKLSESVEILYWKSIEDSKDVRLYQSYLDKFPHGYFATIAKIFIEKYNKNDAYNKKQANIEKPHDESIVDLKKNHINKSLDKSASVKIKKPQNKELRLKYRLAFLPSIFERDHTHGVTSKNQYDTALNAINRNNRFSLVYTYWDHPEIDSSLIWKAQKLFSESKVDINLVRKYFGNLDADYGIIMRSDIGFSNNFSRLELFIVELKTGKIIYHSKSNFVIYDIYGHIEKQVKISLGEI